MKIGKAENKLVEQILSNAYGLRQCVTETAIRKSAERINKMYESNNNDTFCANVPNREKTGVKKHSHSHT